MVHDPCGINLASHVSAFSFTLALRTRLSGEFCRKQTTNNIVCEMMFSFLSIGLLAKFVMKSSSMSLRNAV